MNGNFEIETEIRSITDPEFRRAVKYSNATTILQQYLDNMFSGVINVWGAPNHGKNALAHKLAHLLYTKKEMFPLVTMDFINGFQYITKNKVLLVKQGAVDTTGKDETDTYGAEQYYSYAAKRQAIVIIISTKPLLDYVDLSIEAIGRDENILMGILTIKNKIIGHIKAKQLDKDSEFELYLQELIDEARLAYSKSDIDYIMENIHDTTKELLDWLFPARELLENKAINDKEDNAIEAIKIATLADVGSGKSTFTKIIHQIAIDRYGEVHARKNPNDIMYLYFKGWSKDPKYFVQYLVCDDATYGLPTTSKSLEWHIQLRHLMNYATGGTPENKSTGRQHGIAMSCLNFHRITGKAVDTGWRDNFKAIFLFSLPSLPWDRNYIRTMLKNDVNYDFLVWLKKERKEAMKNNDLPRLHQLYGMGVCVTDDEDSIPFQLHACNFDWCDIPKYKTASIPELHGSSKWFDTWEQIADEIIKTIEQNMWKVTTPIIKDLIAQIELREYGILRSPTEAGINYSTLIKNRVQAYFDRQKHIPLPVVVASNDDENEEQNNEYYFDGSRFRLLRDLIKSFWISKGVVETYSRILTSYYIWSKELYHSNSKSKKIYPAQLTIDKLPPKQLFGEWEDEINTTQNLYQAKSGWKQKYKNWEKKLGTHDLERIGEAYAYTVLKNELEHLSPSLGGVPPEILMQYRDDWNGEHGMPHDLVVRVNNKTVVWINHKLMTSAKRIGITQYDDLFGTAKPPVRILWFTYTRPMQEYYYVSEDNGPWIQVDNITDAVSKYIANIS